MVFDSIVLSSIKSELNKTISGGKVSAVSQPSLLEISVMIRNNSYNFNLLISADADNARIHLSSTKKANPKTPPNFCMLLRKYLKGARLKSIEQNDLERILLFNFDTYEGEQLQLICEIMGKHSNIILVNETKKILGVIKPVGRSKNRYRELLTGRQYVPPPEQTKADPFNISRDEFDEMLHESFNDNTPEPDELQSWLVRSIAGISPFAAKEIVCRAESELCRLGDEFEQIRSDILNEYFSPVIISDTQRRTIGFYPFALSQYPEENQFERSSISAVADVFYSTTIPQISLASAKTILTNRVEREIEARNHTIAFIKDGLIECENADRYKQLGEIILAQSSDIAEGSEKASLLDYYDTDCGYIDVNLDSTLSPIENAEAYFRKYQKAVSGKEALSERLIFTNEELLILNDVKNKIDSANSEDDIKKLELYLQQHGIKDIKQEVIIAEKKHAEFDGFKIIRHNSGNFEILVGMNSQANDHLLTRIAKPNDIWVHVKASPSAHVIIRTNNKPDTVSRQVIENAAELAVRNSDSKHSSLVPVDYTLRKYVRKPKGAPSGKAIYNNEKTIYITPTL